MENDWDDFNIELEIIVQISTSLGSMNLVTFIPQKENQWEDEQHTITWDLS